MKTLKSMLAGAILLFVCVAANAAGKPNTTKLTRDDVIGIYINAIAHGDVKNLNNVLDDGLKFDIKRGENVNTLDKDQLIAYLKGNTVDPAVTTATTVAQEDDNMAVIKVDFKYADYTRTDMVTITNSGGWTITKVVSSFK